MAGNEQHLSDLQIRQILGQEKDGLTAVDEEHLASCEQCRERLASETADPWWWKEGRRLVASSIRMIDDSPPDFKKAFGKTSDHSDVIEIESLIASFEKPIHPELLGTVEEYEIESLIGCGGMGAVFKGVDRELNRTVAIKFLLPCHSRNGLARQRFIREAKSVAAVRDDNVVPIFRINASGEFPYFVMPFIPGDSLEQHVIKNGCLETLQLLQIARQIATGLAAAHEQGIIHRDIKPANILLENDCNRVVVTDFGLAREIGDLSMTQTGLIAGTPKYMSPEQTEGKPLDQRSDLFSLGAVMYWMATGRTPFGGENLFELFNSIRVKRPTRIRQLNPNIPAKLERAIDKLLEKKMENRFADARRLESFLSQYSAHLQAPTTNREPKLRRNLELTRWHFVGLVALVTTLIVANLLLFNSNWFGSPRNDSPNQPSAGQPSGNGQSLVIRKNGSTDQAITKDQSSSSRTESSPMNANAEIGFLEFNSDTPFDNGTIKIQSTTIEAIHVELSITDQTASLTGSMPPGEYEIQYVVDDETVWSGTYQVKSGATEQVKIER